MAFIRTRTINGLQYRYLEERYREGGKVKSRSKYLGRVAAVFTPIPREEQGLRYIERLMEKYPETPVAAPATSPAEQSPSSASDSAAPSPEADAGTAVKD